METIINTLPELEEEASRFVSALEPKESGATLITLSGELGTGKTAFTKAVAKAFGVADVVNSPTFVLEKIYTLPKGRNFKRLVHIDAYRLEKGSDLGPLGFDELLHDTQNLIVLEWPEKVADALPVSTKHISFLMRPDNSRTLSYG